MAELSAEWAEAAAGHQPTTPYPRFHLALPVLDLDETLAFYVDLLGCPTGRSSAQWVDLDFYGHQLVLHQVDPEQHPSVQRNAVDGHEVPASHFGPILEWTEFEALAARFQAAGKEFVIEPNVRFAGRKGEQATMFIADPSGNHLEFKAFRNLEALFAADLDAY
ncbi:MAG: VOC family protein [Pseudomonadota bacterium]